MIHLRGGDVFPEDGKAPPDYVQNPLSFYTNLIKHFKQTIVVCEPGNRNPIIPFLESDPSITLQSSTVEADFSTLLRARNIATSGVGTFAIAAALCSNNLKRLFCTDRYLTEHLNPEMIRSADVHCLNLGDDYIHIGEWDAGEESIAMMLNHQVDPDFFEKIFAKK